MKPKKPAPSTNPEAESSQSGNLTLNQKLFCEFYLGRARGNATEAARMAGYSGDDAALAVRGAENRRNPKVQQYIQERFKEAANISADEVMTILARQARGDMGEFLKAEDVKVSDDDSIEGERYVQLTGINPLAGDTRLIRKYRRSDKGESIELYSSFDAAREIAELMGMKVQRHVFSGPDGGDIPISTNAPTVETLTWSAVLLSLSPEARAEALAAYEAKRAEVHLREEQDR